MDVFRFPLAKTLVFFASGIIGARFLDLPVWYVWPVVPFLAGAVWCLRRRKNLATALLYLACLTAGFGTATAEKPTSHPDHFLQFTRPGVQVAVVVLRERLRPSTRERYVARVERIGKNKATGRLLLRLPLGTIYPIGTRMLVATRITGNSDSGNPDQFEYGRYLDDHGIAAQANVISERRLGLKQDFYYFADCLRLRIFMSLRQQQFNETSVQLLGALILGARQDISPQVTQNFQAAGAVHVLAVSGLHIGFVVLLLQFLLKPLPRTRPWLMFRLALVLSALWLFAGISGFSPSVVRAATMFSFIAIGRHMGRDAGTMHAVVVSAFVLLAAQSSFIYDVGFQLSYAAVVSILFFEKPFRKWRPGNKISRYVYDIMTVSLAAQLGTLPLTLLYFHQFPGLFLLTNLLVLPLLTILMFLGMAVCCLAAFGMAVWALAAPLDFLLRILDSITRKIASADAFFITDVPMDGALALLTLIIVLTLALLLRKPGFRNFACLMIAVATAQSYIIADKWVSSRIENFLAFRQPKSTLICSRKGGRLMAFGDRTERNRTTINSYATANRLCTKWGKPRALYYSNGQKILVLYNSSLPGRALAADIVVLRQSPKCNLERLILTLRPRQIVADASNYKSLVKVWESTCRKQKIPFHNVYEKGCFMSGKMPKTFFAR